MDAYKAKEEIKKLAESIARIEIKSNLENRVLSNDEESIIQEMKGSISALKDLLPQKPLRTGPRRPRR